MADAQSSLNIWVKVVDDATGKLQGIAREVQQTGFSFKEFANYAATAAAGIAALGGLGFRAAISEATTMNVALLRAQYLLAGTGVSIDTVREAAEKLAETSTFDGADIVPVLARNIKLLGDYDKALAQTQFEMNLAAFAGIDLTQAQNLVTKASDENLQALRKIALQLGINIPEIDEHANKSEQFALILGKLKGALGENFDANLLAADGTKQFKKAMNETAELVGQTVMPAYLKLINEHVKPALLAYREWAAAHPELNLQMIELIAKIVLVSAVLAPVLAALPGFILLLQGTASAVLFAASAFKVLTASILSTPTALIITVALAGFLTVMNQIAQLKGELGQFDQSVSDAFDLNQRALDKAKELEAAGDTAGAQRLRDVVRRNVSGEGEQSNLPYLAKGGIVDKATAAIIGESGPEAVIPLDRLGQYAGAGTVVVQIMGDVHGTEENAVSFGNEIARIVKNNLQVPLRA